MGKGCGGSCRGTLDVRSCCQPCVPFSPLGEALGCASLKGWICSFPVLPVTFLSCQWR